MDYSKAFSLDGTVELTIRDSNYYSLVKEQGLSKFLNENIELPSDSSEATIANFSALVSRTVDIKLAQSDAQLPKLASHWANLWKLISASEWLKAYYAYLELNTLGNGDNLTTLWNKAILSTDSTDLRDVELTPQATQDQKKASA